MNRIQDTLVYKLYAARKHIEALVSDDFESLPITHDNYITLHFIYENPGISQKYLAILNDKDKNVMAHIMNRFVENGYVRRERNAADKRAFSLYVTDKGEGVIHAYWGQLTRRQNEALEQFNESEQASLMFLLDKLSA